MRNQINIPKDIRITTNHKNSNKFFEIQGPLGINKLNVPKVVNIISHENTEIILQSTYIPILNTFTIIFNNSIIGVLEGYEKRVILNGLGYKALVKDNQLNLRLGTSHDIIKEIPKNINVEVLQKGTLIIIKGIDKQEVNYFTSEIKHLSKPDPYKGKGITYPGEKILLKKGKR